MNAAPKPAPLLALNAGQHLARDGIFDAACPHNRDDCMRGFRQLRDAVQAVGGRSHTVDVFAAEGLVPDVVLHLDVPRSPRDPWLSHWQGKAQNWVLLQECEVIVPWNWQPDRWVAFNKIFTWNDDLVDDTRFIKYNHHLPFVRADVPWSARPGFLVVIAGNKRSRHPLELYSKRLEAVRWAGENRPGELDLYGRGWDRRILPPTRLGDPLSRTWAGRKLARPPRAYRGPVESKIEVLSKYRFSLCLENAQDITGYITEKLFDVMLAGAVPIYRGADNIVDHVPENTFIDLRRYSSWPELWKELEAIDEGRFNEYQVAMTEYLHSATARGWSSEGFVDTLMRQLT